MQVLGKSKNRIEEIVLLDWILKRAKKYKKRATLPYMVMFKWGEKYENRTSD